MIITPQNITVHAEGLDHPESVVIADDGTLFTGGEAGQIYRIDDNGPYVIASTGGFVLGLTLDGDGAIYACDCAAGAIFRVDSNGDVQRWCDHLGEHKLAVPNHSAFTAGKMEVCIQGPYTHNRLNEPDDAIVKIVAACREAVGDDYVMMVDVAYCWPDAHAALRVLHKLEPYALFFVETPIDIDDLDGYAMLHERSPIRIAAGEWQNTHYEFLDLADRGRLDVLQPDVGRVGGFTEARRVAQIAADRGRLIVPHCWKSAIGIAASAHLCAATACCPYIEYLPAELSDSALRRELAADNLTMNNGRIALPQRPGLGVDLSEDALERFSAATVV
jgi:L-alanine-DL-glutamate epimerase-like enolase superfamily enzyme